MTNRGVMTLTFIAICCIVSACKAQGVQKPFPYPVGLSDVPTSLQVLNLCTAAAGAGGLQMARGDFNYLKPQNQAGYRGTEAERFWRRVQITDNGCWEWQGGRDPGGYGRFVLQSEKSRGINKSYAHIWSYKTYIGPVPDGLELDHLCRNPSCVNPLHLEPVTHRVNIIRAMRNAEIQYCIRGHYYSPDNTYIAKNGGRVCRTCVKLHKRAARKGEKLV